MDTLHKVDNHIIYHDDCLEGLNNMSKNSIQLTVTSPPYYNVKNYVNYDTYDTYLLFLENVFKKILDLTEPGRFCCVNISNILIPRESRNKESSRIPLSFHFVSIMEKIGWIFQEDIIWVKPEGAAKNRNGGFYQHRQPVAYKPNIINEYIFVFKKSCDVIIDKIIRKYDCLSSLNSKIVDDYERSNVWYINPETHSKHPAPYPIELTDKLIRYYSFVGDTVLDPFFGTGTTCLSCHKYNRKCIGFEIHKEYIDIFISKIKNIVPNKLIDSIEIDISEFSELSKDDIINKLMKNPKNMLFEFLKEKKSDIKNDISKKDIVQKVYDYLF